MVDLHSHILPGLDDGAKSYDQSVRLTELELENGVDTVALTPHFFPGRHDPAEFLDERDARTETLNNILSARGLELTLIQAAEVRLSPELTGLHRLKDLCYSKTGYMLIELPPEYFYHWVSNVLYELRLGGITPILAHVERYSYFIENPALLSNLVDMGCFTHVNADSLILGGKRIQRDTCKLILRRLVHLIATDSHSAEHRPPRLKAALEVVRKKFGEDLEAYFCENAEAIATGRLSGPYLSSLRAKEAQQ